MKGKAVPILPCGPEAQAIIPRPKWQVQAGSACQLAVIVALTVT